MALGLLLAAGAQIGSSLMGANAGAAGARSAYKRKRKYYRNAQGIITSGYGTARDTVTDYSDKAQKYQDPYLEMGTMAQDYFTKLDQPGGISNKYKEYLSVGDPIFDYADKKTREALNAKLAATGRLDSGKGIEDEIDRSSKIAYEFSDLADRRIGREFDVYGNLMNVGQSASNTSTNLQYNTGGAISNLYTGEAQLNSALEAGIGDAAADYASTLGNINMNKWGNIGGALSTGLSGMQGVWDANSMGGGNTSQQPQGQGVGLGNFQMPTMDLQSFNPGVISQQVQQQIQPQQAQQQIQPQIFNQPPMGGYGNMYSRTANITPITPSGAIGYSNVNQPYNYNGFQIGGI